MNAEAEDALATSATTNLEESIMVHWRQDYVCIGTRHQQQKGDARASTRINQSRGSRTIYPLFYVPTCNFL
jgi:hypothetical protein